MKRHVLLILALWGFLAIRGQGIYYQWWIDDNRAKVQNGRLAVGEQTVAFDLSAMPYAGLHFLNIVPYADNGEQGVWKCMAFMVPECWPGTSDAVAMEYWVSSYDKVPIRKPFTGSTVSFDIDISRMSYGLHFLNYRTQNLRGEYGPWKQMVFYINNFLFDPEEMEYEYWIDSGEKTTGKGIFPGTVNLQQNVNGLTKGKHTFNFRAANMFGTYGETYSVAFNLQDITTGVIPSEAQHNSISISVRQGLLVIESNTDRKLAIYQPNGILVKQIQLTQGQNFVNGLKSGIYIIEGMKFCLD